MTDQERQKLAREYAEQNPPADVKDEVLKENLIRLNAEIFEKFLVWLTKTHCIVSREKVAMEIKAAQNELNEPSKPMLKFTLGYVLGLLHNLLESESMFEERSEE